MSAVHALTVLQIARHMREASARQEAADARQMAAQDGSPQQMAAEAERDHCCDEVVAWQQLGLARRAFTLPDVAAQLGLLFILLSKITASDLESQVSSGDLAEDLDTIERALAWLAATVGNLAGVDFADIGEGGLPELLEKHAPSGASAEPSP